LKRAAVALLALAGCQQEPVIVIRFEPQDLGVRRVVSAVDAGRPPTDGAASRGEPAAPRAGAAECARDSDCVVAKADCCGCAEGGKAVAIPRAAAQAHEARQRAGCRDVMCVQSISRDPSCSQVAACRRGACALLDGKR
jgi:hypothetical protein